MNRSKAISLLKAFCYAGIYGGLLMPLVFIPIVIFPFVFSKLVVFQTIVGLTFPAYLILAWMEPALRPKMHLLYAAITAYFLALGLSVVFAVDPLRAWWGNQERMNGLFTLLHFFAWLTMTVSVLKTWNQWRRLLNYEVGLSAVMAFVAILQKIYPSLLLFKAGDRVGGLLDNPIYMAAYQIFNLFFLALLFLRVPSRNARIVYAIIAGFDVVAFLLAQSRGAFVGLAVGILAFGAFYSLFAKNRRARWTIWGIIGCLFIVYGILFSLRNTAWVQQSMFGRLVDIRATVSTRFIAWDIAWKGFLERPITGWGFDNFHILFNLKYNPQSLRFSTYETWFDRAHNTALDVLSMTGILGFLTFVSIFLAIFYSSWRAFRKGWIDLPTASVLVGLPIAYFVQNLFVFDHPAGFSMSYLLFAFTIAATRGEFIGKAEAKEETLAKRHEMPWIAFAILLFAAALLVLRMSVMPFRASRLSLQSNSAYGTPQSLERSRTASQIWTPYLDEQAYLLARNLTGVAAQGALDRLSQYEDWRKLTDEVLGEELRRHPRNTTMLFLAARYHHVLAERGKEPPATAEQYYLQAIETSPKRQQLHYALAQLYGQAGKTDQAFEIYKRVRDFDPELGMGHWLYGLSLFYDHGDRQEGAKELALSQSVAYPYNPTDIRELIPLADAYEVLGDRASLSKLVEKLANLPAGELSLWLQLAAHYHRNGMTAERDAVLDAAQRTYPNAREEWAKGLERVGMATSTR